MSREEAKEIFLNRGFFDGVYDGDKWREACIVISEWLEQEPILDKIRAEIEQIIGEQNLDDYDFCSGLICARKIIDKYKAESEG